jgi:transposase-like protein
VRFSLSLKKRVISENLGFDGICEPETACKYCGSTNVIKKGFRKRKNGKVQVYKCRECERKFVLNESGFHKMKNNPKVITLALDLYFKGVSLRKIKDHLKQFHNVDVSHVAIYGWIEKYVNLMKRYVDKLVPEVGRVWQVDEQAVNVHGEWKWLWNLMDADTRFLLASQLTDKRKIKDARKVFRKAKEIAKDKPDFVITDGLRAYEDAFKKEFFTLKGPRTRHVRLAGITKMENNNLVERYHGTFRERDKVMRAFKKSSGNEIIDGFRIYYNFIRPHMALDGKTPAEIANIDLQLARNKWLDLIRKSVGLEN